MSEEQKVTTLSAPVGIVNSPGAPLQRFARAVPDDRPALWGESQALREVGQRRARLDGIEKVTGRVKYTCDVHPKGMLYARVLRSAHAHARVLQIDTSAAEKMPGVAAVHVLDRLRGVAQETGEEPAKAKVVRYAGQPLAAVAAATVEQADAALRQIRVRYEVLPHVVTLDDALKDDAPLVFARPVRMAGSAGGGGGGGALPQRGNVRGPRPGPLRAPEDEKDPTRVRDRAAQAMSRAAVKVEATYRTQVQTHSPLETHGLVAEWTAPDELTVWASTQGLYSVADELAEVFGLDKGRVRVHGEFCGGGFGAKFGAGNYGVLAAHLAKQARAPVRLCLDRREQHESVGNRPGSLQKVALGADEAGKLLAIQVQGYGSGGAGAGAGFAGPAQNLYPGAASYTEESDVFTHTGPLAAFRAPGHPQGVFALEQAMDELAERLRIDPLVLRERNDAHPARREERRIGAARCGWAQRHPAGAGPEQGGKKRGLGMAQGLWYHLTNLNAHAEVRLHRDGAIELLTGVQDIGGGVRTPLAQVVAEELGVAHKAVKVVIGDSRLPLGPASGGSVTTASITPAARDAAFRARVALLSELHRVLYPRVTGTVKVQRAPAREGGPAGDAPQVLIARVEGDAAELRWDAAGIHAGAQVLTLPRALQRLRRDVITGSAERAPDLPPPGLPPGAAKRGGLFGQLGGVQFVQVAVDTGTGVVCVEKVWAIHDCGRPINPLLAESQVRGGVIQGVSYALFEERRLDRRTGQVLNGNLEQYQIAGAKDAPEIDVVLLEQLRGLSSTDASGIGEPATVPTAAAVANAIYNAIGVRVRELPITPARVLAALAQAPREVRR